MQGTKYLGTTCSHIFCIFKEQHIETEWKSEVLESNTWNTHKSSFVITTRVLNEAFYSVYINKWVYSLKHWLFVLVNLQFRFLKWKKSVACP